MEDIFFLHNDSGESNETINIEADGMPYLLDDNIFWKLKTQIKDFTNLQQNWDGYDAVPVLEEVADTASTLLNLLDDVELESITDIYPNPHGTITMEWQRSSTEKFSLEIGLNNYSYFVTSNNSNPTLVNGEDVIRDFEQITSQISLLAGNY